jgi:hypothetical protein
VSNYVKEYLVKALWFFWNFRASKKPRKLRGFFDVLWAVAYSLTTSILKVCFTPL